MRAAVEEVEMPALVVTLALVAQVAVAQVELAAVLPEHREPQIQAEAAALMEEHSPQILPLGLAAAAL